NAQVRLDNSGIYFVRVRANGQAAIRKVVVR
ncbi:T9SS type A sorting domain-containing protein, partial [bacterium]|nr:T9SS type A sorting domain-containing protein [bacterium]